MSNQKVIKDCTIRPWVLIQIAPLTREERIVITPNPTSADADDDFGFTTTISTFNDGKRYNPTSDTDE